MTSEWNRESVTRIRLRRKVSLAVLVVDDFTGRPVVTPDVAVAAVQTVQKPVRKSDGWFLLLDCAEKTLDVTVTAWAYHTASVRVDLGALAALRPVVKLRLTPNRNYSIPHQTTCLEGTAPAGSVVRILCENDPRPLRLLYDYVREGPEEGRVIRLYDPTASDLDGREFALLRKGEREAECFIVWETLEDEEGAFRLHAPLTRDCKKAGATVLPVQTVLPDARGMFFLPLRTLAVKNYSCRVLWTAQDGRAREKQLELEPGRVTRLELSEND